MIQKATEKAMPKMYVIPDILYAKQAKEEKIRTEKTGWLQEACRVGRAEKRGEGEKWNFKANPLRGDKNSSTKSPTNRRGLKLSNSFSPLIFAFRTPPCGGTFETRILKRNCRNGRLRHLRPQKLNRSALASSNVYSEQADIRAVFSTLSFGLDALLRKLAPEYFSRP